jgi:hypothetical protein
MCGDRRTDPQEHIRAAVDARHGTGQTHRQHRDATEDEFEEFVGGDVASL